MTQLIEKNYLLKVLTLSGAPKLITFGLTLLSFPLVVRALGAENYGTLVFIGSSVALFEVLMDFGVSSASGKAMAEVRTHRPRAITRELYAWARLQVTFVAVGFGPMVLGSYMLVQGKSGYQDAAILWVLAAGACFSVAVNFLKANLQSLLAFKSLAVLDTAQSVIRSAGLLIVAFLVPTVMGLALAGVATAVLSSTLAVALMALQLKQFNACELPFGDLEHLGQTRFELKSRLQESANFLWLRFATRMFQEGPNIIFGRSLGPEVVGIVAAFRKIVEILSVPYLVIGNGVMVRIHEVARKGEGALLKLWDGAFNIAITSVFFAVVVYISAEALGTMLMPDTESVPGLFALMSLMVISNIFFALIAPMSDYLGGLRKRNVFLTIMSLAQMLILALVGVFNNVFISVFVLVLSGLIVAAGYVLIARKVFFNNYKVQLPLESLLFLVAIVAAVLLTEIIVYIGQVPMHLYFEEYVYKLVIFVLITLSFLFAIKKARTCFIYFGMFRI
jgi:O-antigen/teichoic acid export membrane protein